MCCATQIYRPKDQTIEVFFVLFYGIEAWRIKKDNADRLKENKLGG